MDNIYDEKIIIIKSAIETNKHKMRANKQDSDEKTTKFTEEFKTMIAAIIDQINTLKSSPAQKYISKSPNPTTVVPNNRRSPPLDVGQSTQIGVMLNLKHEISSPKFYELLIKTELK